MSAPAPTGGPNDEAADIFARHFILLKSKDQLEHVVSDLKEESFWVGDIPRPLNVSPVFMPPRAKRGRLQYAFVVFDTVEHAATCFNYLKDIPTSIWRVALHKTLKIKLACDADMDTRCLYDLAYEANVLCHSASSFFASYGHDGADAILSTYPARLAGARQVIEQTKQISDESESLLKNQSARAPRPHHDEPVGALCGDESNKPVEVLKETGGGAIDPLVGHQEKNNLSAGWVDAVLGELQKGGRWSQDLRRCFERDGYTGKGLVVMKEKAGESNEGDQTPAHGGTGRTELPSDLSEELIREIPEPYNPASSPFTNHLPWILPCVVHIRSAEFKILEISRQRAVLRAIKSPVPLWMTPIIEGNMRANKVRYHHLYAFWSSGADARHAMRALINADTTVLMITDEGAIMDVIHVRGLEAELLVETSLARLDLFVRMMLVIAKEQAKALALLREYNALLHEEGMVSVERRCGEPSGRCGGEQSRQPGGRTDKVNQGSEERELKKDV